MPTIEPVKFPVISRDKFQSPEGINDGKNIRQSDDFKPDHSKEVGRTFNVDAHQTLKAKKPVDGMSTTAKLDDNLSKNAVLFYHPNKNKIKPTVTLGQIIDIKI